MKRIKSKPLPPPAPSAPPAAPVAITSLAQAEALCSEGITVTTVLRGQVIVFTGRRLLPREVAEVKILLDRALPPKLPAEAPGGDERYDLRDPGYLRELELNRRSARALGLWFAYPIFREQAAAEQRPFALANALADVTAITAFIESRSLDDDLLESLWKALTQAVVSAEAWLGFTSGSSIPKN